MFAWMKRKANSFFSANWPVRARRLLPLAAGVMLTAVALLSAGRRIAAVERTIRLQSNPVEIVVAAVPIPAGASFAKENLAKKSIPSSGVGRRNVPASEFELLLDARARTAIEAGEPVLWTDVEEPYDTETFSHRIRPGRRGLTLAVDGSSTFSGLIHPGDRVDLLLDPIGSGGAPGRWIPDIPVLAVDRDYDGIAHAAAPSDPSNITLMVTPSEGARIAGAAREGRLHWFLRNSEDNVVPAARPARNGGSSLRVEVWKGGIRALSSSAGKEVAD